MPAADLEDVALGRGPELGDGRRPLVLGHLEAARRLPQWQEGLGEQRVRRQQRLAVRLLRVQRCTLRLAHLAALLLGRAALGRSLAHLDVKVVALVVARHVNVLVAAALRHGPLSPRSRLLLLLLLLPGGLAAKLVAAGLAAKLVARLATKLVVGLAAKLAGWLVAKVLAALVEGLVRLEGLALGPRGGRVGRTLCPTLVVGHYFV